MQPQDAERVAILAKSIWSDRDRAVAQSIDTVGAVALLGLPAGVGLKRAAGALLTRGVQDGPRAGATRVAEPFFRLSTEERFALAGITKAGLSYERIAELLSVEVSDVEELLWGVRLSLAHLHGGVALSAIATGVSCPEVAPSRPWTQAYLDDEMVGRQKWFIETHTRACVGCAKRVAMTREVLFKASRALPTVELTRSEQLVLDHTLLKARAVIAPTELSFGESVQLFCMRPETKFKFALALTALALVLAFRV